MYLDINNIANNNLNDSLIPKISAVTNNSTSSDLATMKVNFNTSELKATDIVKIVSPANPDSIKTTISPITSTIYSNQNKEVTNVNNTDGINNTNNASNTNNNALKTEETNWLLYGGIGLGAILLIYLMMN